VSLSRRCSSSYTPYIYEVLDYYYLVVKALLVADDLESHELVRLPVEALHTSAYVSIRQHTLAYSLSY
jgi:hypothetical protein